MDSVYYNNNPSLTTTKCRPYFDKDGTQYLDFFAGISVVNSGLGPKAPAPAQAGKIRAAMREKGGLIGVGGSFGNVLRIQPPLFISNER